MTWPLVKPTSGYRTLSRLDSVSSRFPTRTVTLLLGLTDHLTRGFVRSQPAPSRVAQPSVTGPLAEAHLADNLRVDPMCATCVFARHGVGKRRVFPFQRFKLLPELPQGLLGEPG